MTYDQADRRFDINRFFSSLKGKNIIEMLNAVEKELSGTRMIKISSSPRDRDVAYLRMKYEDALKGFNFLISSGIRPAVISQDFFQIYTPLVKQLIADGAFPPEFIKNVQ